MRLDDRFDLLKHLASNELVNLPYCHVFNNFEKFHHAVANTTNGPQILHMLIEFMKHDIGMAENILNEKTLRLESWGKWKKMLEDSKQKAKS